MTDEPEVDFVSRVGGAILLAETEWTPKAGVSKERAMALAAIEAMRKPTEAMKEAGYGINGFDGNERFDIYWNYTLDGRPGSPEDVYASMINAALR